VHAHVHFVEVVVGDGDGAEGAVGGGVVLCGIEGVAVGAENRCCALVGGY
jgi:hypothetical protein